jgi:primary-amine oxidase
MAPHPLDSLDVNEINIARQVILDDYSSVVIDFREIFLQEPAKAELQKFLHLEHTGYLSPGTKRPARLATCQYDVVGTSKIPEFHEATVDISNETIVDREVVDVQHHASLTL